MSLAETLTELSAKSTNAYPEHIQKIMREAIEVLEESGIGDSALKAGDKLPDATLPDALGNPVKISDLLAKGPLVINFYRGGWCPYCNMELKAYQDLLGEIEALGGQLVAVSPEKPDNSLSTAEKNEVKFPVLSDTENAFAKSLGIVFELTEALQQVYAGAGLDLPNFNADSGWTLPIPATFVVGADGTIILSHVERNYRTRLEPAEAVAALRVHAEA